MIDLDFLKSLIQAIDESSLDSIEIERGGTRVRLSKTPEAAPAPQGVLAAQAHAPAPQQAHAAAPAQPAGGGGGEGGGQAAGGGGAEGGAATAEDEGLVEITSPMVGTFYRAPAPDAPPYVEKGDRIAIGDTLCIIEAMKLMNELEAEQTGTIVEVLVDNAEPVEYGQVLFKIRP